MTAPHVDGFSTAGEVLAGLCRCQSPVCPLPHAPSAVRAYFDGSDCTCLEARCRRPHTMEAAARFVLVASGFELWSLRHQGAGPVVSADHDRASSPRTAP